MDETAAPELDLQRELGMKGVMLSIDAIMRSPSITPATATALGCLFAARNAEAAFHLGQHAKNKTTPNPALAQGYGENRHYWEDALRDATQGDYRLLKQKLHEHAEINQTDRSRENGGMNPFGVRLVQMSEAIPDQGERYVPSSIPVWKDPAVINAPKPNIDAFFKYPTATKST